MDRWSKVLINVKRNSFKYNSKEEDNWMGHLLRGKGTLVGKTYSGRHNGMRNVKRKEEAAGGWSQLL